MTAITRHLYFWVLLGILIGGTIGYVSPETGVALKPLGDGFIALIKMLIAPIIFCTVVLGIAGAGNMKKVGRVGGKALLYFEVVSTIALVDRPDRRQRASSPATDSTPIRRRSTPRRWPATRRSPQARAPLTSCCTSSRARSSTPSRLRRPAAGAVRRGAVRIRDDASRAGRQHRPPGDHDGIARVLPHDERADDAGADRRRRGDGVHDRPLRRRRTEAAGIPDGQFLPDVPAVHLRGARHDRGVHRLQHLPLHRLHQRGVADGARHFVVGVGAGAADAEARAPWLFEVSRRAGRAGRLFVQP